MNLTKYKGRPEDTSNRLEKEIQAYDFLDQLNIDYDRVDHDCIYTMEGLNEVESILNCKICKNLFLCNRQQTAFYLLLMPGDKVFKTKEISAQINSARLSFGNEDRLGELLNLTPGSITIMGLMFDKENKVRLLIDNDLLQDERLGFHPCINSSTLAISNHDFFEALIPSLNHEPTFVTLKGE